MDIPPDEPVTFADAPAVVEDWRDWVAREDARLVREYDRAGERYTVLSSLVDIGLGALGEHAASIPGGAFLVGAFGGLGGLFLRRPGDKKREQELLARARGG